MQDPLEILRYLWAPLAAVGGWVLWSLRKATASKEELQVQAGRINRLEARLQGLATKEDLHDLALGVTRLDGKYEAMQKSLEAQSHAVKRIEDYLLNKDKG